MDVLEEVQPFMDILEEVLMDVLEEVQPFMQPLWTYLRKCNPYGRT